MTNIEELIENLEAEVGSAWQLPMSGGKVLLDIKEIKKLLTQIKEGLPESIVQARRIVEDRSKIIDKASDEAQTSKAPFQKLKIYLEVNSFASSFISI